MGSKTSIDGTLDVTVVGYASPDGRQVGVQSNMGVLFSDDFGGAAVDTAMRWDVFDGGLGANPTLRNKTLNQAAIGSGVSMMTGGGAGSYDVGVSTGSALTVKMGTNTNAEFWLLSQQAFAGTEDLTVLFTKTQSLLANSISATLVEVDPATLIPIYNAAAPSYTLNATVCPAPFTNMGGVEIGMATVATAFSCVAIGDSSTVGAVGSTGAATAAMTTTSEFLVEFHAEDIITSNGTIDSPAGKAAVISRVSTQCPNDSKVYKLLLRFRNIGTPGSSTFVTIPRVLVVDSQEMRVEVASGRGDNNAQKAVAVNIAGGSIPAGAALMGGVNVRGATFGGMALLTTTSPGPRLAAAASGFFKATSGQMYSYDLLNTTASVVYLQLYQKATAGIPGTDTPVMTIPLAANGKASLSIDVGWTFTTGIAWAVTTDAPGATIAGSGAVVGTVGYV
jgi:hypothetical protein